MGVLRSTSVPYLFDPCWDSAPPSPATPAKSPCKSTPKASPGPPLCSCCHNVLCSPAAPAKTPAPRARLSGLPDDALELIAAQVGSDLGRFACVSRAMNGVAKPAIWRDAYQVRRQKTTHSCPPRSLSRAACRRRPNFSTTSRTTLARVHCPTRCGARACCASANRSPWTRGAGHAEPESASRSAAGARAGGRGQRVLLSAERTGAGIIPQPL